LLLRDRANDIGAEEEPTDGFQTLKRQTFLRWSFFVLGALFPAVKMSAMDGIPWTKTWGIMFLMSFIFVEILVIYSWRYSAEQIDGRDQLFGIDQATLTSLDEFITGKEGILFLGALFMHIMILFKGLSDLWPHPSANSILEQKLASRLPAELSLIIIAPILSMFAFYTIRFYIGILLVFWVVLGTEFEWVWNAFRSYCVYIWGAMALLPSLWFETSRKSPHVDFNRFFLALTRDLAAAMVYSYLSSSKRSISHDRQKLVAPSRHSPGRD
jgi:hypothetical protein